VTKQKTGAIVQAYTHNTKDTVSRAQNSTAQHTTAQHSFLSFYKPNFGSERTVRVTEEIK
jgi:hypothetical protein